MAMVKQNLFSLKQLTKTKKITLGIILVAFIIVGTSFLLPLARSYSLRYESNKALKENRSQIDDAINQYTTSTARVLGVGPAARFTIAYNSCYTDHDDGGWIANNYNYNCLVTDFKFFEVKNDSELMAAIKRDAELSQRGNSSNTEYYGNVYSLNISYNKKYDGMKDLPNSVKIVMPNTYTDVREVLSLGVVSNSPTVVAYASADAIANRVILNQKGSEALDPKKTYIVLQYGYEYFHKDIGCRIPALLFCESPI